MLDVLNRYAHGFVVVPVALACRRGGLFDLLQRQSPQSAELAARLGANAGHLQVTLRLLESLGWIDVDADGHLQKTTRLDHQRLIPEDVLPLLDADMDAYL